MVRHVTRTLVSPAPWSMVGSTVSKRGVAVSRLHVHELEIASGR